MGANGIGVIKIFKIIDSFQVGHSEVLSILRNGRCFLECGELKRVFGDRISLSIPNHFIRLDKRGHLEEEAMGFGSGIVKDNCLLDGNGLFP